MCSAEVSQHNNMTERRSVQGLEVARQGHSKNPPCNGVDSRAVTCGVVFAGGGHRAAGLAEHRKNEIAQGGKGACAGPDPAAIFVHRDVAPPMQPVLDPPMGADQLQQALRSGIGNRQAGHEIGDLAAGFSGAFARPFDAQDLGSAGPFEVGDTSALTQALRLSKRHWLVASAASRDGMPLLDGLGPSDVRR